jgi:hypothetical protein
VSDDPVIAALARCRLPDGVTSIDADAVAGVVRTRLARFETPQQQARTLEQLTEGTASFAWIDMRGDYVLLVINSDTYDSREVGQFHRSSVDVHGRLSSHWAATADQGPSVVPPPAGRVIAAFAGLAVAAAASAIVGFPTSCHSPPSWRGWFGLAAFLLTPVLIVVIVVTFRRKGLARTVLCVATGSTVLIICLMFLALAGCVGSV